MMELIKGFLFLVLLLYASYSDLKSREISNWVPISIAITGLIGVIPANLLTMILSAVAITLPQLVIAALKEGSYGGGDIKLMAACAFLLGPEGGFVAIIIGLSTGLFVTAMKRKLKKENLKEKFPVVPFLAFGSFVTFLLTFGGQINEK